MKASLHFNLDDDQDKEKHRCALKASEMSGVLDSFLDYLLLMPDMYIRKGADAKFVFEEILATYMDKILTADIKDMVDSDLHHYFDNIEYPSDAEITAIYTPKEANDESE